MTPITQVFVVLWLAILCGSSRAAPVDGLAAYFTALEKGDKELMKKAIDAPDGYKEQFVKMIDVTARLSTLSELLNAKYEIKPEDGRGVAQYLPTLQKDLLTREFKVDGDHAESVPKNENEVPVALVRRNGNWVLDLRKGQTDDQLKAQAKLLGASYDALISLFNGLIQKVDTLDTHKFSYDEAWTMVDIQMNRKLEALHAAENRHLSLRITPIVSPDKSITVTLAGNQLTTQRKDEEPKISRLKPHELKLLWTEIEQSSQKNWSGFWASSDLLDGYMVKATLKGGKTPLSFKGANGCPPGFSKVLKIIGSHSKSPLLSHDWKGIEEAASHYSSFEDYIQLTTKAKPNQDVEQEVKPTR